MSYLLHAPFLLGAVEDNTWVRQAPLVWNARTR